LNINGSVWRWAMALSLPILLAAGSPARADGSGIYYQVSGELVIFTNTPSGANIKAVPGMQSSNLRSAARLPVTPYDPYIELVAAETGLSPSLIKAVALVESGFDPQALSPKGAQGLMQLMPATAKQLGVRNAFDPGENLRAGARYLRSMLDEFDGDLNLALAAYNAGPAAVRRHGGVPAYRETRDYVSKVRDKLGQGSRSPKLSASSASPKGRPVRMLRQDDGSLLLSN
jgi:soluble lytic murein transglycosylase-like protein